jgi:hypothetical protein
VTVPGVRLGRRAAAVTRGLVVPALGVPALVMPALAPPVAAQQRATSRIAQAGPVPELRAEAAFGRDAGTVAGAGLFADAGLYARVGVTAAGGVVWADTPAGRRARGVGEVALVGRFLLDPLRAASRGVYAGGGLGVRVADGASRTSARSSARPFLLGVVGVEGRRGPAGLAPAVELGVGGGARVAVVLRRARLARR